jgi:hypothetical protein
VRLAVLSDGHEADVPINDVVRQVNLEGVLARRQAPKPTNASAPGGRFRDDRDPVAAVRPQGAERDGGLPFSDGQTKVLARLALATIVSPLTLAAVGNNLFIVSSTSGTPAIGTPDTGGRGSVIGAALEFSNVDIAREFTSLMTAQRGFQANSRVITTADELNQEAINLKR